MSDSKSITPIVVGVVIALLGILTGFYIATNAREQLQGQSAAETGNGQQVEAAAADAESAGAGNVALPELPAVEATAPAVTDEKPMEEEVVEKPEVQTVEPDLSEPDIPAGGDMPDDFEEVTPEEMQVEEALPADSSEQ